MASNKDKYNWHNQIPLIDHHSIIKHKIITEYLSAYIPTVLSNPRMPKLTLSVVDGFCGGGIYKNNQNEDVYGSPIQLIEAIQEARIKLNLNREKPRVIDSYYYFIDSNRHAISNLKALINTKYSKNPYYINDLNRIYYKENKFLSVAQEIVENIKLRKGGERAIFVLDQYGYADVNITMINWILKSLNHAEVILTFNIESMMPYFSKKNEFRQALANLGIDNLIDWNILESIPKNNHAYRKFIQREISSAIRKASGAKHMTLFFIKPQAANEWGYWLVHLTNQYKAHVVMKSIHWENATFFGHELEPGVFEFGYEANKDYSLSGSTKVFDFDDLSKERCLDALQQDFGKILHNNGKQVSIAQLFPSLVSFTPASESHLHSALRRLHEEKSVHIENKEGRLRKPSKQYRPDDIIIPNKQLRLILP